MKRTFPTAILLAAAAAALVALPACRSLDLSPEEELGWPELREAELGQMANVHVCGPLWFGSAPARADLELAARRGIEVVIDATSPAEALDYDWARVCERLGLEPVDLEVGEEDLDAEQVDFFLGLFGGQSASRLGGDVLLYCGNGQRSATLFAIYRVVLLGVPLELAVHEARRAGMKPGEPEQFVRRQVQRLRPDLAQSDEAGPGPSAGGA